MDDLISRAAVLEELADLYWTEERFLTFKDVDGVFDRIKALPSAQPELIRCKNCKHNQLPSTSGNAICEIFYGMTDQNGFCHMAEPKEEAEPNEID
ncbi:MAG: hypothetical protein IIZ93_07265 [Acidaminococcaceae bacterium]|nr:hypothetical protein [Acidaminococcaceae bacterium]